MPASQKPVILFIINRLVIGGQSLDTVPLAYYLQSDFDVHLLYGMKEKDENDALFLLEKYPGLKAKQINRMKRGLYGFNDIAAFMYLKKYIGKIKPAVVHTHGSKPGLVGRLAAYVAHVPCIIHTYHGHVFHSYYNRFFSAVIKNMERMLGKITTHIIALSNQQQHEITKVYKIVPENKCAVIPLGIDVSAYQHHALESRNSFRNKYHLKDNDVAIGIIGRMVAVKNHTLFVDIIIGLQQLYKQNLFFFFIGDGELKPLLQKRLTAANIRWSKDDAQHTNVFFTSWLSNAQQAINGLDIITLTSLNEGTPLSLIESQACGKPIVAANVGGVKDTIIDKETGFLVDSRDANDYISKLQLLIENKTLREAMGVKGKSFVENKYSKPKQVAAVTDLYKECTYNVSKKQ